MNGRLLLVRTPLISPHYIHFMLFTCLCSTRPDDHGAMVDNFVAAMSKLSTLGQTGNALIDCSDVIPVPISAKFTATLPPGKSMADIDRSGVCIFLQPSRLTLTDRQ